VRTGQFVSHLYSLGIKLWLEDERLCCDAPAGVLTANLKSELRARKVEIATFLRELGTDHCEEPRIRRVLRQSDSFLASFNQKRLWFLDQLLPNSAYNCYRAFRVEGPLNFIALEKSLNKIVRRHEALRTKFVERDGQPFQVISPPVKLNVSIIDLCDIEDAFSREAAAQRIMTEEVERPFDLSTGTLFRAHLLRLAAAEHTLLLTMHHAVTDRWSNGILLAELGTFYDDYCNDQTFEMPEPVLQYVDFSCWQAERLHGKVLDEDLSFWRAQLRGAPEVFQLPSDRPRPSVQSFEGSNQDFLISKDSAESLNKLAQAEGVTLYMTLLAAFKTLLFRYSGQEDIVIGSPIAGRIFPEIEKTIGLFINTLVFRTDLSGNPSFRELLQRVRDVAFNAYAHQEVPFEKLVEHLHLNRSLSVMPAVQVMFALQNTPERELSLYDAKVTPITINRQTSMFDLFLALYETEQGLQGWVSYRTDMFDASTIVRMIDHFKLLLEAVVADPDRGVADVSFLAEKERRQLLLDWNDTATDFSDSCIHELFERQVSRTPDVVAVVSQQKVLTYRELNERANKLAHYLKRLGVQAETLVGVCVERSMDLIVGILGILKAGGAYVPLDPAYPKERLAFMLKDVQLPFVLTQQQVLSVLPTEHGVRFLCIDTDWDEVADQADSNLDNPTTPENLAYVIYTSGSTGKPNGVKIAHSAMVNFLTSMQREPGLAADDILLAVTTLSFDIAGLELYLPLTVGARVVIVGREVTVDGALLAENIAKSSATIMQATPTTWQMLLETGWQGNGHLRVLCGGEVLTPDLASELLPRCASLWNMYGPTETTVWSAICKVNTANGPIPIGRPIANTQLYILDRNKQPVPIGIPGELYIGGKGLAQGYLNRPELTEERFVPNPFTFSGCKRLYKTGDLAKWNPDGNTEMIGRVDHQIKIRGFRVEAGEIETVLRQHPTVRDAIVIAREDGPGDKRLCAYIVLDESEAPVIGDLRDFLKKQLPQYMLPNDFVFLGRFPLTANGKIDRRSLPAPDTRRSDLNDAFATPQTQIEEFLAEMFADVLRVKKVGIHDNFFELGGHSLLAVRFISRLREALQVDLALRALFEAPTVAELAKSVERIRWTRQVQQGSIESKDECEQGDL
jgi:amino acid adenylation domain-containing protein